MRLPEGLQTMEAPGQIFSEWDFSVPWDRVAQDLLTSPRQLYERGSWRRLPSRALPPRCLHSCAPRPGSRSLGWAAPHPYCAPDWSEDTVVMRSAATGDGVMASTAPRCGSTDVRPCGRECPCSLCILTARCLQGGTANVQPASTSHEPFLTSPEGRPSSLLCVLCSAFSKAHQSPSSEYTQAA